MTKITPKTNTKTCRKIQTNHRKTNAKPKFDPDYHKRFKRETNIFKEARQTDQ